MNKRQTLSVHLFESLKQENRWTPCSVADHHVTLESTERKHQDQNKFHRKFLAFLNREESTLALIVGPLFSREPRRGFYYHQDLLISARSCSLKEYVPSGGGEIVFSRKQNSALPAWEAHFGDYSERFGVYDVQVLTYREHITDAFGVPMIFTWTDQCIPQAR